jgi:hypothetical protein
VVCGRYTPNAVAIACPTSELHQRRAEATERKLGQVLERMEAHSGGPQDFPAKAAFVTFNRGMEVQACLASCPHSEFLQYQHGCSSLCRNLCSSSNTGANGTDITDARFQPC